MSVSASLSVCLSASGCSARRFFVGSNKQLTPSGTVRVFGCVFCRDRDLPVKNVKKNSKLDQRIVQE